MFLSGLKLLCNERPSIDELIIIHCIIVSVKKRLKFALVCPFKFNNMDLKQCLPELKKYLEVHKMY